MKILEMKASFGQLNRDTLALGDGLNIVQAPNEAGKSTWCAFIKTMLYGMNTSQRDRANVLSDKTKFTPWDGSPMEGSMRVSARGEDITITRATVGKTPMRSFSAVYTGSGEHVENMTSQNAGQFLTGVTRDVFERTAFIGRSAMRIDSSQELEKRMMSIVTAGDEGVSYTDTKKRLTAWQHRIKYRSGGILEKKRDEYAALCQSVDKVRSLNEHTAQLQREEGRLQGELRLLEKELATIENDARRQTAQRAEHYKAVYEATRDKRDRLERELTARVGVVSREDIEKLRAGYEELSRAGERADEARQRLENAQKPDENVKVPTVNLIPAMITAAAALVCALLSVFTEGIRLPMAITAGVLILAAVGIGAAVSVVYLKNARSEQSRLAAEYRNIDQDADAKAREYAEKKSGFDILTAACGLKTGSAEEIAALETKRGEYESVCSNLQGAYAAWQAWDERVREGGEIRSEDGASPRYDREQTVSRIEGINSHCRQLRMEIDRSIGQISAMGDGEEMQRRKTGLEGEIARLENRYRALTTAIEVLDEANARMQKRFSPEIGRKAGQILASLTGGKYDRLTFDRELSAAVKGEDDIVFRSELALSRGASEQIYLALRLALCHMLLGQENMCPIILDDALAYFDDERAMLALEYLRELSGDRQIILFTCHSREAMFIGGSENVRVIKL